MKRILSFVLISFGALLFSGCGGPSPQTLYTDYLAGRDFKNEKYEEALAKYYALLENDGNRAGTHSNIGVLLDMVQKSDEAEKSLLYALGLTLQNNDLQGQFLVHYNLGVHYGAQKKFSEALAHYQAALELVPNSKETKTNIEILIQQQQKQQQGKDGDQKQDQKQDQKDGQGKSDPKDGKDQDQKDKDNGQDQKDKDQKDDKGDKKEDKKKQSSPKYQPRPFKGDQLSEGDVKKILGELKNQEQKIRAHFDKKEKGKSKGNDKDW